MKRNIISVIAGTLLISVALVVASCPGKEYEYHELEPKIETPQGRAVLALLEEAGWNIDPYVDLDDEAVGHPRCFRDCSDSVRSFTGNESVRDVDQEDPVAVKYFYARVQQYQPGERADHAVVSWSPARGQEILANQFSRRLGKHPGHK